MKHRVLMKLYILVICLISLIFYVYKVHNLYVRVFSLDFCKAFDTVRLATLMEKLSTLDVPAEIY